MPVRRGDVGGDPHARIDQGAELGDPAAAADGDGADLGDRVGPRWLPPVVSRSTTQKVTSRSGVPSSSKVSCGEQEVTPAP
ncbi:hypothetical protein [Pseudonocardia sp. ICBG601]|uniref:hypothetical protein n=1 Tax=Pseudonocardia sp. ICBG601 TaxID=2846759 RepID=UPI001CF70EA1|nr:hypothetical protein [Pseudonocardia sp. ICBG601]